jgi:hypothetical protein
MATRRIVFIPVKHGGHIELGRSAIPGIVHQLFNVPPHVFLGFKPAPGRNREGWAVFAVLGSAPNKPKRKL